MSKKLTLKEQLFVKHYVKTRNGTEAAKLAGYSEKTAAVIAQENLTKPYIRDAVNKSVEVIKTKIDLTTEMILKELMKIAFADISEFLEWKTQIIKKKDYGEDGQVINEREEGIQRLVLRDSAEIKDGKAACVSEVTEMSGMGWTAVKIKLYDKLKALELLGKHLKMFNEKVEISGPDGQPLQIQTFIDIVRLGIKKNV